jgi:hypothetical protein
MRQFPGKNYLLVSTSKTHQIKGDLLWWISKPFCCRCARCGMAFTLPQEVSRHVREAACVFRSDETKSDTPSGGGQVPQEAAEPITSADVSSKVEEDGDCTYLTCSQCSYQTESRAELLFHEVLHGDPITDPSVTEDASDLPGGLETTVLQIQVMCLIYLQTRICASVLF